MTPAAKRNLKEAQTQDLLRHERYAKLLVGPGGNFGPGAHRKYLAEMRTTSTPGYTVQDLQDSHKAMTDGYKEMQAAHQGGSLAPSPVAPVNRAEYRDGLGKFLSGEQDYRSIVRAIKGERSGVSSSR
jgi:hypothetical protein